MELSTLNHDESDCRVTDCSSHAQCVLTMSDRVMFEADHILIWWMDPRGWCARSHTIIPSDTSLTCLPLHSRTVPVSDVQITAVHAYRSMDHSDARVTYIGSS